MVLFLALLASKKFPGTNPLTYLTTSRRKKKRLREFTQVAIDTQLFYCQ
jgi:hypothetical protein